MSDDLIKARLDNHEERLEQLEKNTKILETMNYRIGQMEESVKSINTKLDSKINEKGKKWDKLVDYLFYFVIATILGYLAIKLGLK